ncbi:class I SAM-dependent methyltransferase [Trujillonella endophytica]|uniref:Methyltransferase domain-containing protein n=1 Tax=Trujillonella endophytica TaxID=673521 RepID=A0A1H8S9K7_9ACTN|nr:class I SAM-dependent methyltransferase [Trujillella endophytica]SEO75312.1 Methyltransferase domain-containing protein [Trujillella endophytica]
MPSVEDNRDRWANYDWSDKGDEWSGGFGSTEALWSWLLQPRVSPFLPSAHTLEIAPGFGRATQFLVPASEKLTVVDLVPACIAACQERFAEHDHIDYHVNDGRSLDMIEDGSIDFVFSWDSLIHAEDDVVESYVTQLGRKLRPGGAGVLHHSNVDEYRDPESGELTIGNEHWRAPTMSAAKFRRYARAAGLRCVVQELIPWGGPDFSDCLSVFRREVRRPLRRRIERRLRDDTTVVRNSRFFEQVQQRRATEIRELTEIYRRC